jgi:tetratricopeptide (TPR) repeat protein
LSEALKQKPELAEAHNNLGNAFRETGRIDEAVRHDREALRLKPGYAGALSNFAGILKTQGKIAEAIENYRAAISLRPDFIDAHNNLIMLLGYSAEVPHEELVNQTLKFNGSGVAHSSMFPIPAAGCESDTCPAIFAITRSIITSSRCCNITSTAISNSSPTPT